MKGELGGKIMKEFLVLIPKMYSYLTYDDCVDKQEKDTKKCVIKQEIKLKDFKTRLEIKKTALKT